MESKYIQFPVSFLPEILTDKERVINNIFHFGLYGYSKRFKYKIEDVARQVVYFVYRGDIKGFKRMLNEVEVEWIGHDEDYNGFSGDSFNPEDEIKEMLELFDAYPIIKETAIEIYQMHLVCQSLGISGKIEPIISDAKEQWKRYTKGDAMAMIKTRILFDFRDHKKTEFEIVQLLAYCAIKSIIGKKEYKKTNWKLIVSRMLGFKSSSDIDLSSYKNSTLLKFNEKRYWQNKLREHLELEWKVKFYSNANRGFYVCDGNKLSYDRLAEIAESKKKRTG